MRDSRYVLLLIAACLSPAGPAAADAVALERSREEAIELARAGDIEQALGILSTLREADTDDTALLHDETIVLAWAGQDRLVLDNAAMIDFVAAPDYVIRTIARSARNIGEFEVATSMYRVSLDRDAGDLDARRGLAMTYADAGNFEQAWIALDEAPDEQGDDVALILTEAHVYEWERRFLEALASYQRVAELQPENRAALRGEALMLRAVLLPRQALALARQYPDILTDEEIINLEADVAALQIRYGAQSYYPVSRRYEGTDMALAKVDELLTRSDLDPAMLMRLRFDRIVALTNRLRTAEAVREFEALNMEPEFVPAYALEGVGRAYLNERQPEVARDLLLLAAAKQPDNFHIKFQLFFAYTDLRDAKRAVRIAEELLATLPETNQLPGSRVIKGNQHYLRAAIMFGLARAYFDQLAYAQKYFEDLLAKAPHNTDIRHELANVYRWRGWHDRSLSEYAQVLAVEPDLMSARAGSAHARLDSRDYAPVEREVKALVEDYSDEPAVKKLADRWQLHNSRELVMSAEFGESSGPTFGNDQYNVDIAWFSRPLARQYRALVFTHDAYADFPEGDARRARVGAGIEYRHIRWHASASLSASRYGGEPGFRGTANYRLSDLWSFGAILETESNATSLRGYRIGVSSNIAGLNAAYTRSESSDVRAQVIFQDYSDGNSGVSILVRGQQRFINRPSFRLAVTGEVFADEHSRSDVVYFSPKSGFSWNAGLRYDWLMTRRYDFGLTHTVVGKIGRYRQFGYDADGIWSLNYAFEAEINNSLSAHVGLSRRSNIYDGDREYATFFVGGFRWKF